LPAASGFSSSKFTGITPLPSVPFAFICGDTAMLWTLFSLPLDRFVACRTSLFSLGLLTMPLTGPLIDPLIAPLMFSESVSDDREVKLPGDQDCRFFFFCNFSCVGSVGV
jgi:hypothetical protein